MIHKMKYCKTISIFEYPNCWDVYKNILVALLSEGVHQAQNILTEEVLWVKNYQDTGRVFYIRGQYILDTTARNGVAAYQLKTGNELVLVDKMQNIYSPVSGNSCWLSLWIVEIIYENTTARGLYDDFTKSIIWQTSEYLMFSIDLLHSRDDNVFKIYNINTGQPLWQLDVGEIGKYTPPPSLGGPERKGKIIVVLGQYNGIVWLHLENSSLLGIDVDTGNVLYKIGPVWPYSGMEIDWPIPSTHKCSLDHQQGYIIGMAWKIYWTVDLNQTIPQFTYHWLADELDPYQVYESTSYGGCFSETHFFFAQYDEKRIASLNRQTLKVDWIYQLEPVLNKRSIINRMKYDAGYLYVFETAGLLHIFNEKPE